MTRLERDLHKTFDILDKEDIFLNRLYLYTNERIIKYYNYANLTGKNVFCITASGDHAIYASYAGARNITCCDQNELQKYVSDLKIGIIKAYDEIHFNKIFEDDCIEKFNIKDVEEYINESTYYYWKEIFNSKLYKKNKEKLFKRDGLIKPKFSSYDKVKDALLNTKIVYFDTCIEQFWMEEEFDAAFISNIIDWSDNVYHTFDKSFKLLKKDGLLYDVTFTGHNLELRKENLVNSFSLEPVYYDDEVSLNRVNIYRK